MAKRRRRRGGRRKGGGGAPRVGSLRDKAYLTGGAAVYGYIDNNVAAIERLPTVGTTRTARNLSHGLLLHVGANLASGELRRWLDLTSVGALSIAGYNFGKVKGDMAALEGDDVERIHLEGEFDPDEDDIDIE